MWKEDDVEEWNKFKVREIIIETELALRPILRRNKYTSKSEEYTLNFRNLDTISDCFPIINNHHSYDWKIMSIMNTEG